MATKKIYTIEIQMDAARNALADANKKLAELDASLEGIDKQSDAGKLIVAEMAKVAAEIESATANVEGLTSALDNLKPGTIGALKEQARQLELALEGALAGSADADALIAELGKVKAQLKDIDESVDVAFSRDKAGALMDAVSALAGAFNIATVAAQNFGLTEEDAEKYNQKLLEMISVVQSLEAVHKLTTGEVSTALKGLFGDAKRVVLGYFGIGQASTAAGGAAVASANVTRIALASLGIGLVLAALFLVYSNWEKITGAVKRNKEAITTALLFIMPPIGLLLKGLTLIEKKFGSLSALASGVAAAFKQGFSTLGDEIAAVLDGDLAGAAKIYENRGRAVADAFNKGVKDRNNEILEEGAREVLRRRITENEALLTIMKAQGKDTAALEDKIFRERLATQKKETQEEKDELTKLRAEYQAFKEEQLRKAAETEQATELATLNARLSILQAGGQKAYGLQVEIKQRELAFLLAAPQRNNAAIIAKEAEISVIREAARLELAQKEFDEFKKRVVETERLQMLTYAESEARKAAALAQLRDELGEKIAAGTARKTEQLAREAAERAEIAARRVPGIGDRILVSLFGVTAGRLDAVKASINESAAVLYNSVQDIAANLLSQATAAADARLAEVQGRLEQLDQQLQDRSRAAEETARQLDTATGARRDFLLSKLAKERQEQERLAATKAKAAKEEQAALKERARLELQSQRINAASIAIQTILGGIEAGRAIAKAAAAGKFGFDNIAYTVAQTAALVAGFLAVKNAAKFQDGGVLPGGVIKGGSHASGNDVPVFGGRVRVEGGEAITPVDATTKNLHYLELIRTAGRQRTLLPEDFAQAARVRVLPSPAMRTKFADGGVLPTGPASAPAQSSSQVLVEKADLQELLSYTRQVAANTAMVAGYGPAALVIGPEESLRINAQREQAEQTQQLNTL